MSLMSQMILTACVVTAALGGVLVAVAVDSPRVAWAAIFGAVVAQTLYLDTRRRWDATDATDEAPADLRVVSPRDAF